MFASIWASRIAVSLLARLPIATRWLYFFSSETSSFPISSGIHLFFFSANLYAPEQVRLVSKYFFDIPCKELFKEIFVECLPDSLNKLQCIVKHPILSRKVQKITYLTDRLDSNIICRSRWESLVRNVDTGTLSPDNYRKYSKFCALQGVQQQLSLRQEDLRIIHDCVSLLGNIREIVTTSWPGIRHNPVSFLLFRS